MGLYKGSLYFKGTYHVMSSLFKVQNINVTSKKNIKLHVLDNLHIHFSLGACHVDLRNGESRKERK